jgi:hypothetical protein
MPRVGFEPMIAAVKRANIDHALDRAATVIGIITHIDLKITGHILR